MLLQRIAAGDPSAVPQCLEQYGNLVWSAANRWSATQADAEDAVQEIFIDLWKSASRFDPSISSESGFVMMVARRRLIDRGRRKRPPVEGRNHDCIQQEPTCQQLGPSEQMEFGEEAALACEMLEQLRDEEKQVLKLAIYEGLTHQEVSKQIGLPLGTVKTHLRRGLQRLRERLAKCGTVLAMRSGHE